MAAGIRLSVLGPVRGWRDGIELDLGYPKRRAVLAALVLSEGTHVSAHRLVDALWGEDPPRSALATIRSHVYRLRQVLGDDLIRPVDGGYTVVLAPDTVDLAVFRELLARGRIARAGGEVATAAGALDEALALWHGTPLAGVPGPHAEAQRRVLAQLRLAAVQERLACRLDLGRHEEAASELSALVAQHPLVEPLREMLMIALYGAGRQADALAVFDATRRVLRDELGVDPTPRLREIHRRVLTGDPTLIRQAAAPVVTRPASPTPAQLPADVPDFVDRADELRLLAELAGTRDGAVSPVVVIGGMAGIGKTTLAVHSAHRAAAGFPDGQLYVDLRGFDPDGAALDPLEALGSMVHALGVPTGGLPAGLAERAAFYRSLLARRRVLVVLDNARDAAQVRPLLPGGPGCLAIVTSRNQLPGLTATHGAHPVRLRPFEARQARRFLHRRLGRRGASATPEQLDEIVEWCGRLPLALAIVAARAAQDPDVPLGAVAEELRASRGSLDAFAGDDPVTNARAVFSWSYRALPAATGLLFRLLSLHPGPAVTLPAAASLAALPVERTRALLAELARAHLITDHGSGRYGCHDLLRAHATELAGAEDDEAGRDQALRRLLGHYTHSAAAASRLYSPARVEIELPDRPPAVHVTEPATAAEAADWFAAEYPAALDLITQAGGTGRFDGQVWRLAWALAHFLDRRGLWHELAGAHRAALAAGARLGDPVARGYAHTGLARAELHLGRLAQAGDHAYQALDLFDGTDVAARADTHRQLSWVLEQQGRYRQALTHARQALDGYREVGRPAQEAVALNAVGWYHALLGRYREAIDHCQQALRLLEQVGDRFGQADTRDSIGYAHHRLGDQPAAIRSYQQATRLFREIGARYPEAASLVRLGEARQAAGDAAATAEAWTDALVILDELEHVEAPLVRARLRELAR